MGADDRPLDGKVALVTGASRGIGRALALSLAAAGADLVVTARTVTPRPDLPGTIHQTAEDVRALGRRCLPVGADLSDDDDARSLVGEALDAFGHVDVLVNNAAAMEESMYDDFWGMTLESWNYQLHLNLTSPWLMMKLVAPGMRQRGGGTIVSVTSGPTGHPPNLAVNVPGAHVGAIYPASKVALNYVTQNLAADLRPHGIAIIALHPGHVRTENGLRLGPVGGFQMQHGADVELPVAAFEHVVVRNDPMGWTGTTIFAPTFVEEHHLL